MPSPRRLPSMLMISFGAVSCPRWSTPREDIIPTAKGFPTVPTRNASAVQTNEELGRDVANRAGHLRAFCRDF